MKPKKSKKPAKPMARKAMKKAKGGLGDGSVRFISDSISPPVWAAGGQADSLKT